jgi:hypothetical protein
MALGIIPKLDSKAQIRITQMGVPIVFPQGNLVSQTAKKTERHRDAAINMGSWVKVMLKNRKNHGISALGAALQAKFLYSFPLLNYPLIGQVGIKNRKITVWNKFWQFIDLKN